jgi:gas vesicle protein
MTNTAKIITAIAAGAVAGAVLGVLFAPDKGTETRRKVSEEGKRLAQTLREKFNRMKERSDEVVGTIQESIDELEAKANMMREKMNQYSNS